jgi:hypothetical protein
MFSEFASKDAFEAARRSAYEFVDGILDRRVYPAPEDIARLTHFIEELPEKTGNASDIVRELHEFGSAATVASMGGRYFGLVTGGAIPVSLGVRWLADSWDQCAALYKVSPINATLETVCEGWLRDIFGNFQCHSLWAGCRSISSVPEPRMGC